MFSKTRSLLYALAVLAVLAPVKSAPTPQEEFTIIGDDLPRSSGRVTATSAPSVTQTTASITIVSPKAEQTGVSEITRQNALAAQQQNAGFANLNVDDACQNGEQACISGFFVLCASEKWQVFSCGPPKSCFALPKQGVNGTGILCVTESVAKDIFADAGVTGGITGSDPTGHCTTATSTPVPKFTTLPPSGSFSIDQTLTFTVNVPKSSATIVDQVVTVTTSTTTITVEPSASANALFVRERPQTPSPVPVSSTTISEASSTPSSTNPDIVVIGLSTLPGTAVPSSSASTVTPITVIPNPTAVVTPAGSDPATTVAPSNTAGGSAIPVVTATGADGIVTVVIMSASTVTVTAPATACAPSNTIITPSVPSSSVTFFTTPTISPQETTVPVIIASSSAPVFTVSFPSASASSSTPVVVSSTTSAAGRFSFSTGAPFPTVVPSGGGEFSDISVLLTATVGGN
ncbi:hypothetical protein JR316_0006134 [Psilocybe cubensis]|uniref:Carbohydrate-binding module family 19 domain-containing protein n=2 Tax=Psilocybe cubensis TaxID=181762 RepID=A0A8H8CMA4_PSICU|nr:hypothetical protein JR316_0006134 [Psilocybe cubensis]KAH9481607.1 hypothetical protein JR316_0006134 [Psilocybe cubensis]